MPSRLSSLERISSQHCNINLPAQLGSQPASAAAMVSNTILAVIIIVIGVFVIFKTTCILWCCYRQRKGINKSRLLDSTSSNVSKNSERSAQLLEKLNKLEMDCSDVSMMRWPDGSIWELGSGGFGRVVKGVRAGVQEVAIKMLFQTDQKAQEAFLQEISMLKFVSRDRNIVQFFGASVREDRVWLITELMEGGDLRRALAADEPERMTWWNGGKRVAVDVARGLAFLHSNHVIHRDLKSKNILLTKNLDMAKIGDWGMAKIMSEAYYTQDTGVGTFAWAAPEMLLGEKCTEKVDIYSFGICLWEIATGQLPMRGHITVPSEEECPDELRQLIQDCMHREPDKRPSATEVFRRLRACEPNPEIISVESSMSAAQLSSQPQSATAKTTGNSTWTSDINTTQSPWTSGTLTPSSPTTVLGQYQAEILAGDSRQTGKGNSAILGSLGKPLLDEPIMGSSGDGSGDSMYLQQLANDAAAKLTAGNPEDSMFLRRLANDASAKLTVIEARQRPVPAAELVVNIPAHHRFLGNLRQLLHISSEPSGPKMDPAHGVATNGGLPENPMGSWQPVSGSRQGVVQTVDDRSEGVRQVGAAGVDGIAKAGVSKEELHPSWCDGSTPGKEIRLNILP